MFAYVRAIVAGVLLAGSPQAFAQGRPKADPDWPCRQVKTPTVSLASIWSGPDIDLNAQTWRDDPDVVDLANKMAQRRYPMEDVEKAIAEVKAKAGANANAKLLQAFGAAFQDLTEQRAQVLLGVEQVDDRGAVAGSVAGHDRGEERAAVASGERNDGGRRGWRWRCWRARVLQRATLWPLHGYNSLSP